MLGSRQGVLAGDVELIVVHIVQEHVHAAQVVRRNVDLLAVEALPDILETQDLRRLQEQGTGTAGRIYQDVIFDTMPICARGPETA